jgi:DNA-binding GntR family transcriptional regulator
MIRKPTAAIETRSLRELVYEHLKAMMAAGRIQPGGFLDLNALAADLGISRTPVRDALIRLESEGFAEILSRRGVRIAELTLGRIRDIYEILGALESAALRSVAARITPGVTDRMAELNEEMSRALDAYDFGRYYDANLAFHDAYLSRSENAELVGRIRILKQRLYDFPRLRGFVPEWERASIGEHEAVVTLLRAGRVEDAADYLRDVHWSFRRQEPFVRRYYAAARNEARSTAGAAGGREGAG